MRTLLLSALLASGLFAAMAREAHAADVAIDESLLQALNPSNTAIPLSREAPASAVSAAPRPGRKPKDTGAGIVTFPITAKVESDEIDPATLPQDPQISIIKPPLPQKRPALQQASTSFVNEARRAALGENAPPAPAAVARAADPVPPRAPAGPTMPAVRPGEVTAVPLGDALGSQLTTPDRQALVRTIEAIHAGRKPASVPEAAAAVEPASSGGVVRTPAKKLSADDIKNPVPVSVPRPPPAEAHEHDFFTIPFKAGAGGVDADIARVLESRVLPQLTKNPGWHLQIQAFAAAPDKEAAGARRLSLARAMAVRSWLMNKGIAARRMDLRALGLQTDRNPPDRVDLIFSDPDA